MLPAKLGLGQCKQESLLKKSVKPGYVDPSTGTTPPLATTTVPSAPFMKLQAEQQPQQRYLPIAAMPTKTCNITTVGNMLNNNNNNITTTTINNNNNNGTNVNNNKVIKTKVSSINILQKQLQSKSGAPPLIQLVAANPNAAGNATPMLSILTPKTVINPNPNSSTIPIPNSISIPTEITAATTTTTTVNSSTGSTAAQPLPVLIRAAGAAVTTVPAQQQQQQLKQNNNNYYSKGGAAIAAAPQSSNVLTLLTPKSASSAHAKSVPSAGAQLSLIAANPLKHAPVILSKASVQKICLKFGQVQARNNASGTLILTKGTLQSSSSSGAKSNLTHANPPQIQVESEQPKSDTVAPMPLSTPISTPATPILKPMVVATAMPKSTPVVMPLPIPTPSPIMPLPIAINATDASVPAEIKLLSSPSLTVCQLPKLDAVVPPELELKAKQLEEAPKMQRSKSLAGRESAEAIHVTPLNLTADRRHSVAIMSKEVDVVEQPSAIETITIDDDDSEEERELEMEQQRQQQEKPTLVEKTPSSASSRKHSTASRNSCSSNSSSDVELILLPQPTPLENVEEPQEQLKMEIQQMLPPLTQVQAKSESSPTTNMLSIVKAESLSQPKNESVISLQCLEQVENSPPKNSMSRAISPAITSMEVSMKTERARFVVASLERDLRKMQECFNMLNWQEQPVTTGSLVESSLRFGVNKYNLLQLAERCPPRKGPAGYFERALFDRQAKRQISCVHPLLYLCSHCGCHGPASDFLAPQFCSLYCVRRASKRHRPKSQANPTTGKVKRQDTQLTNGHADHDEQPNERERDREVDRDRSKSMLTTAKPDQFRWPEYLKSLGNPITAPIHLFMNPFPISPNCFERGMKLEAIDPENCSLFCVCTIVEVRGYRLKLNFDGYSTMYDFWVNADSMDIFPPGWCEKTSRVLQTPKGQNPEKFDWCRYLVKTNAKAAPIALFTHLKESMQSQYNGFRIGMHLEAEDLNDTGKICVATVADVLDERIRVHFDGWDDCYDIWVHFSSPYIHHCGWHHGRQQLIVPPDYQNISFNWRNYIEETGGIAAPVELFSAREPMEFQAKMKLEVVDQRNPCLIRPATVITRKGYRVQLHLDCWPAEYYFWLEDDSPDLHPIGWCEATSHDLESPPGYFQALSLIPCDIKGCRGYGNAKRFNLDMHALRDCCPYAPENWRQWRAKTVKPPRLRPEQIQQMPCQAKPPPPAKESSSLLMCRLSKSRPEKFKPKPEQSCQRLDTHPKPKRVRQSFDLEATKAERVRQILDAAEPKAKRLRQSLDVSEPKTLSTSELYRKQIKAENVQEIKKEEMTEEFKVPAPIQYLPCDDRAMSIAYPLVSKYGPQYVSNYMLWQKNFEFDMNLVKSNPINWTKMELYQFMTRFFKSPSIAEVLFDHDIDGRALLMLGREDLNKYLKLSLGSCVKLYSLIMSLRIAVGCKFKTTKVDWVGMMKKTKTETETEMAIPSCSTLISPWLKTEANEANDEDMETDNEDVEDGGDQEENSNSSDEEDVVLDNDDFLSVKPRHSLAI